MHDADSGPEPAPSLHSLGYSDRWRALYDDRAGDQDDVVDRRYLAGFNYDLSSYATLQLEYRHTEFEREKGSETAGHQSEFQVLLAIRFAV